MPLDRLQPKPSTEDESGYEYEYEEGGYVSSASSDVVVEERLENVEEENLSQSVRESRGESATSHESQTGPRSVSIGWLKYQEEHLKITLSGLLASVALNRKKYGTRGKASETDVEWMHDFIEYSIVKTLDLPKELVKSVEMLAEMGTEPDQFSRDWLNEAMYVREKAVAELLAMSVLHVGSSSKDAKYDARTHRCIRRAAEVLQVDHYVLTELEEAIATLVMSGTLVDPEGPIVLSEEEEKAKRSKNRIRNFKIGAAAVVGATLVGVTGGLALPAIGASVAAWGGTAAVAGAFMASAGGVALFTTLFAAGGLGLTGYKMNKRISGKISDFGFRQLSLSSKSPEQNARSLAISIMVSGGYDPLVDSTKEDTKEDEVTSTTDSSSQASDSSQLPIISEWSDAAILCQAELPEPYQLVWERKIVKAVSETLKQFAIDQAVNFAVKEVLKTTVLASFMAAVAWPSVIITATGVIDNNWAVAVNKAKVVGEELARALLSGVHGSRPVTLVGYSLGALVTFTALDYIASKSPPRNDLILDVVLIGAPVGCTIEKWRKIRGIVAGTVMNCYLPKDWILMLLFRYSTITVAQLAGLSPIDLDGVLNIDVSEQIPEISSTLSYPEHLDQIMTMVHIAMQTETDLPPP